MAAHVQAIRCSDPVPVLEAAATVYAVIPVFNRLHHTKNCLENLLAQSYRPIHILLVDGGSTDDTPGEIRVKYPQVEVIQSDRELWWGEAMQLGIERSLQRSCCENDFILMMNNDTLIGPDYVTTLVRVSRERQVAVCGMVVDSRDSSRILDAGEFIDWKTYSFPVKTVRKLGERFVEGVDLLSGRGTLIPLRMVRCAGNVNGARFPHYIADCEFFARLKRNGFQLGVSCETVIRSHVDEMGLSTQHAGPLTVLQAWRALFSKRSVDNVGNHWRFIQDCAPVGMRGRLKRKLILRCAYMVVSRTAVRHVMLPFLWFLSGSYYVTAKDCAACGCEVDALVRAGLLKSWGREGWYLLDKGFTERMGGDLHLKRLYRRAWNPCTKVTRWFRARSVGVSPDTLQ